MLVASLNSKGWIHINDVAGVADELISGYLTSLSNQSIFSGIVGESKTGKVRALTHDLDIGNNNSTSIKEAIQNSITAIFSKYYPATNVTVQVREEENARLNISIIIVITHNNIEYNVASIIPTNHCKIGEYSTYTKTASPYRNL